MTNGQAAMLQTATAGRLFDGYPLGPLGLPGFDEYFEGPGNVRSHARRFLQSIELLGLTELKRRRQQAERQILDNSVTYTAQGEKDRRNRPWDFDVLPLLIATEDWKQLEAGLQERAFLLNEILKDLYGERHLVRDGLIPPGLVYGNACYMRALQDVPVPSDAYLTLYAADLARNADGRWLVTADRTEAPSGLAYALENRLVASSIFPQIFRDQKIQRLAPFFITLRETLQRLASDHRDNPRIVLLSQGPENPNFFEDAYLSRYLGYTLVEGEDLAVRDERLLLKTLGGLLPVDVVFRRLDDLDCDPLELRGDSFRGVTGLVQALRSRKTVMANALGSGLIESPAFLAYLPAIARARFGRDCLLPNVETWWCGDPKSLAYVLAHLDELSVQSFSLRKAWNVQRPAELSQLKRDQLVAAMRQQPAGFVAQRFPVRSHTPVFQGEHFQPWQVGLRTYSVAKADGYLCLPGGLARVSPEEATLSRSISHGEGSKDAWVLSDGPVAQVTLLSPPGAVPTLRRSGAELPSRVADNLFWVGRLAERAEGSARLLRSLITRLTGESGSPTQPEVVTLMRCLAESGLIEPGFAVEGMRQHMPSIEQLLPASIYDEREPGSLRSVLTQLNRVASLVRERMSLDAWRIINRIHGDFQRKRAGGGGSADLADVLQQLNHAISDLSALSGLVMESMTRTQGWRFLDIGRRIERGLQTLTLTRGVLYDDVEPTPPVLEAVVEAADSLITYRTRYLNQVQVPPVLDLLLTDDTNPRSLMFQLSALHDHVEQLPREGNEPLRTPEQRLILVAWNRIRTISPRYLGTMNRPEARGRLDARLAKIARWLPRLSDLITNHYLIHAVSPRQLIDVRPRRLRLDEQHPRRPQLPPNLEQDV